MQRKLYRVAGQSIVVEAHDQWSVKAIGKLFAGWYLSPESASDLQTPAAIVVRSTSPPPQVPPGQQFQIAGGGLCSTLGTTSYIDIEGSIVGIGVPGVAAVAIWANGPLDIQSEAWTRILTYALAAALRRCGLFELHSGAVVDPLSGKGVLIIGPSGSGKSTLTVQLAAAGWPFLTDDVLALSNAANEVRAWPLRRSFAVTSETLTTSSYLQSNISPGRLLSQRDNKKQFAPQDVFASGFREHCAPGALFFTQISGQELSSVSALSPGETMARLIRMNPWCCYDQATATEHLAVLSRLVKQSHGHELLAGRDLLNPDVAARLIAGYTGA